MNPEHIRALAESSAWQSVRDGYLEDQLSDLKDVTRPLNVNMQLDPGVVMLAKVAAAKALEEIIHGIDRFADSASKKHDKNYD